MPLRLSERTNNSSALSTIARLVLSLVSLRAFRTNSSFSSMLVLLIDKYYTPFYEHKVYECGSCSHRCTSRYEERSLRSDSRRRSCCSSLSLPPEEVR